MVKNIIFDLGGVLLDFNPMEYMEHMGFTPEEGKIFQDIIWQSEEWHLADINKISYRNLIDGICNKNPKYAKELRQLLTNKDNKYILHQNQDNYEYVKYLKSLGYHIYFLSNITSFDLEYNRNNYDVFKLIDGAIYSCAVGLTKPDLEIFKLLLKQYRLDADECIFIDDNVDNGIAAIRAGIRSIRYTNPEKLQWLLNRMLDIEKENSLKLKRSIK